MNQTTHLGRVTYFNKLSKRLGEVRHPLRYWRLLAILLLTLFTLYAIRDASVVVDGTRYYWLDDDQMISMRYAHNLARGEGPVWNIGERVEGYTNPLWVVVMAGVHWLPLPLATTSVAIKLINLALAVTLLALAEKLLRHFSPKANGAAAVLWLTLATTLDIVHWAVNGFETTLLTVVFLWALVRLLADARDGQLRPLTFLLIGLLPLIRSDAFHISAALGLTALLLHPRRKQVAGLLLLAALLPTAHLVWRHAYYGYWLPNTYYLKVGGLSRTALRGLSYGSVFVRHYGVPLALGLVGLFWRRERRMAALWLPLVLGMGFLLLVGDDIFPHSRYVAHLVPVAVVAGLVTATQLGRQARVALYGAIFTAIFLADGVTAPDMLVSTNGVPRDATVAAVLLAQNASADASVAVWAAGVVPYFSDLYTIDLLGKSDEFIAHSPPHAGFGVGHSKFDYDYSFEQQPDYVVTFFSAEQVSSWIANQELPLIQKSRDHYAVRVLLNSQFEAAWAPNPVPVPWLLANNTIFVGNDSAELSHINSWPQPDVR